MSTIPEQMSFNLPKRPGFHYAKLSGSPRLQRVRDFLLDGREHSTMDIIAGARVANVSATISELRFNGISVDCERRGDVWWYKMGKADAS